MLNRFKKVALLAILNVLKLHEYKMRKRHGSTYVPGYDDSYYGDGEYHKPKYIKRRKKKKENFKSLLKKMLE
jgi:hypothetical protein